MPFDKRAYMREYMRRKRAVDPSYGQPSSKDLYEKEHEKEYEQPQINLEMLILIGVVIGLTLLALWIYFKFFYKEPKEEEFVI